MKYIRNGKLVLDGSIKECDLEEKLLKALEIIVDKRVDVWNFICCVNAGMTLREINSIEYEKPYWGKMEKEEFKLLKEIIQ